MVFGVFGGDQDVVNTVECVRDVAEYFVHKALKVLPSIFSFFSFKAGLSARKQERSERSYHAGLFFLHLLPRREFDDSL